MHNVWRMGLTWDIRTGENSLGVGEWAASCCLYIPQRLMPSVTPQWQVTTTQITVSSDISHLKWIIKKGLWKCFNLHIKLWNFTSQKKENVVTIRWRFLSAEVERDFQTQHDLSCARTAAALLALPLFLAAAESHCGATQAIGNNEFQSAVVPLLWWVWKALKMLENTWTL